LIPYSSQFLEKDDIEAVVEALNSPYLTQGPKVEEFEKELCLLSGKKYATVFNSATSALYAAYAALSLEKDSQVVVPSITFSATANMVVANGLRSVFSDVGADGNITVKNMQEAITPLTKCVVTVDFAGNPVDIDVYMKAKEAGLKIVNDASHAIGAKIDGKQCGFLADITVFSFHAIKPITTGEGGASVTDCPELDEKMKLIRSHGVVKKRLWNYDVVDLGFNFRMSDFAAALGISQLKKLDSFIEKREDIARFYDESFKDEEFFRTITIKPNKRSSRHLYPILLDRSLWCQKEEIFEALRDVGLGVQVHYKPLHEFSFYQKTDTGGSLRCAEDFYRSEISIPLHQGLSMEDAKRIANGTKEIIHKFKKGCTI